jgi:hypothetical protein
VSEGFVHHGSAALPVIEDHGKRLRLIAGQPAYQHPHNAL